MTQPDAMQPMPPATQTTRAAILDTARAHPIKSAQDEWEDETIQIIAEGRKDDSGKSPMHLIAPELLDLTAEVLAHGAEKYAPRNWEKGMAWHRPFAALMRHMWAWWRGEERDPETGLSHLGHAACCLMFLIAYQDRGIGADDRPKLVKEAAK